MELYPARGLLVSRFSKESGMLLCVNHGIFYEFIPSDEFFNENPNRIKPSSSGGKYVIILNTNAGLWGYNIGDTIKFVSVDPYRVVVTGRIKHFTSAFGEHVIAEEVEKSLKITLERFPLKINELHLAPQVNPGVGLPYHEWFVEFEGKVRDLDLSEITRWEPTKVKYIRPNKGVTTIKNYCSKRILSEST